jgi:hypothetical protein
MLAFLGYVVQQFVHLPGEAYQENNPLIALSTVPLAAHIQIFLFIAGVELATLDKTYTSDEPWNLGECGLGDGGRAGGAGVVGGRGEEEGEG